MMPMVARLPVRLGMLLVACLGGGSVAIAESSPASTVPQGFDRFVTRSGTRLVDGTSPVRFVSFNIPNLLVIEDAFRWGGERPWRWPDAFELDDAFGAIQQFGGQVARSYVITVRREGSDMGPFVHVTGPGAFNEEAFVAMDRMLAAAHRAGVRVIVPLVDNWTWQGGVAQYAAFRGKPPEAFWTDPDVIADFKRTIEHVLLRRNTITGVVYRDDRAIFGWETGNELDSPPDWTRQIATFIKQLDPHHLVIDGNSLHGVPPASLDEPAIDVITTHHYPEPRRDMVAAVGQAIAATAGRKPFFVGEAGFVPLADLERVAEKVIASEAAGLLFWSLRFRSRDGGFYWHSEPAAEGRYKAFHWPGFPSGDAYDESAVLAFTRDAAARIRGRSAAMSPVPRSPTMLPATDHGAIAWQGSVGATHYVLERACSAEGPWHVIADAAREDHVQNRPLFVDESAPAGPAWYRVSAEGVAGRSIPSAPVGPLGIRDRVFVDEFDDLTRVAGHSPGVTIVTGNARATQEDAARALLPAGGSLRYDMAQPVVSVRGWVFAPAAESRVEVVGRAADGRRMPAATVCRPAGAAGGDYGYLTPLEITAAFGGAGPTTIEVVAAEGQEPVQVSRVEVRYAIGADNRP